MHLLSSYRDGRYRLRDNGGEISLDMAFSLIPIALRNRKEPSGKIESTPILRQDVGGRDADTP